MSLDTYIVSMLALTIAIPLIAKLIYDNNSIKQYNNTKIKDVFYCKKCNTVYFSKTEEADKTCDTCGSKNRKMSF